MRYLQGCDWIKLGLGGLFVAIIAPRRFLELSLSLCVSVYANGSSVWARSDEVDSVNPLHCGRSILLPWGCENWQEFLFGAYGPLKARSRKTISSNSDVPNIYEGVKINLTRKFNLKKTAGSVSATVTQNYRNERCIKASVTIIFITADMSHQGWCLRCGDQTCWLRFVYGKLAQ